MDFTLTKEHSSLSKQDNNEHTRMECELSMHPITCMSMEPLDK